MIVEWISCADAQPLVDGEYLVWPGFFNKVTPHQWWANQQSWQHGSVSTCGGNLNDYVRFWTEVPSPPEVQP